MRRNTTTTDRRVELTLKVKGNQVGKLGNKSEVVNEK